MNSERWAVRSKLPILTIAWILGAARFAPGGDGAEFLLKRLPPDSGITLVVEDLKGHAAEILASPVVEAFERLPAVVAWRKSEAAAKFEDARKKLEIVLESKWPRIRDDLLGDAFLLCFQLPEGEGFDRARGLFLVKPGDSKLLERVVGLFNQIQKADGALEDVVKSEHRGRTIATRVIRRPVPRREHYVILDQGLFVWSNSLEAVRGVIDRHLDSGTSLGDRPEIRELIRGLPRRSFVSLFVNPRLAERLLALSPVPESKDEKRARTIVDSTLKSLLAVGAALEWRGGPILHTLEIRDAKQTPAWLKSWASDPARPDSLVKRVPSSAAAVAAGALDFSGAYQAIRSLLDEDEIPRIETIMTIARGVLLDQDPQKDVLPKLGPGVVVYVDAPSGPEAGKYDVVGAIEIAGGKGDPVIRASLENALRTVLALHALDPKRRASNLRVVAGERGGRKVTTIEGGPAPFAFAFGPGYLVLGTSEAGVARFDDGSGDDAPARLKAEFFPDAAWYARADLTRVASGMRAEREAWIKRLGSAGDFDQVVGLLDLFPNAFVAMTIDKDVRSIHRVVGLVAANARHQ